MIAYQPVLDTIISSGYSGVKYEIEKEISIRTPTKSRLRSNHTQIRIDQYK